MIYTRILRKKEDNLLGKEPCLFSAVKDLRLEQSYNLQIRQRNLAPREVEQLADTFKCSDGQYYYNGKFYSICSLFKQLDQDYGVLEIEIIPIEALYVNNVIRFLDNDDIC